MPKLSNDDLGHAAEVAFALLCAQAGLVANKSERDRTGWDYLVEFSLPKTGPALSLDQRAPTACRVQIKASATAGRVSLKLSAAEQLAKASGPTLVLALRMSEDGKILSGSAIPMLDANLSRVLRRLREATVQGRSDLHKASISFDPKLDGVVFAATPEGIRTALKELCGPEPGAYLLEKQRQLEEVGYEDGRYLIQATLDVDTPDQLLDVLLGLRPVAPLAYAAFDPRFGLNTPLAGPLAQAPTQMRFRPDGEGRCRIQVRGEDLEPPAVFEAEVVLAPPILELGLFKMALKHPDLLVTFSTHEIHFELVDRLGVGKKTIRSWLNVFRALDYLRDGKGRLCLSGWRFPPSTEFAMSVPMEGPQLDQMPGLIEIALAAQRLMDQAGVIDTTPLAFADLRRAGDAILIGDALLARPEEVQFSFDLDPRDADADDDLDYLHAGHVKLGAMNLAYAVSLAFRRDTTDPMKYRSICVQPLTTAPLSLEDLGTWARQEAKARGTECTFDYLSPWREDPLLGPPDGA